MGWSSYQNVIPPALSKSVRGQVVHAHNFSCCRIRHDLVYICYILRYFRMSAGRIVLAASSPAALHRLPEVLLGKRYIKPSSRRYNPLSAYPYDMETTNVHEKQDLFDRCLCTWCLVSFCIPDHCERLLNRSKAYVPQAFSESLIYGSLYLTTSLVSPSRIAPELSTDSF